MCGIAGFLAVSSDAPADQEVVRRMCDLMVHRGPDDHGLMADGPVALGHRRLSIIDLSPEAAQPMSNEDGRILAVVNGEFYNFPQLRAGLEEQGHRFRSRSDSEVAVHLYEQYGAGFVARLRGMFALAVWDGRSRTLILARDRYGKKPLFYHAGPGGLLFASEVQALAGSGAFRLEPDLDAIDDYLALQYVPAPASAFVGVRKLPPGHLAVCRPGQPPGIEPYHVPSFEPLTGRPEAELAEELRLRIREAVRIRLVADVPLGAFLSGGIDSSLVVACMAMESDRPVRTFSIGFPSRDRSELDYARLVAERYGTDHHELVVTPDMTDVVPRLVRHYGEPFGDTSAVPTWYLSRFTRDSVTVALSGDAGDEGFAGYLRYRYARLARGLGRLPAPLPRIAAGVLGRLPGPALRPVRSFGRRLHQPEASRYLGLVAHFPHDERCGLYTPELRRRFAADRAAALFQRLLDGGSAPDAAGRLMELDFATYLPGDILVKVDIASMAHALEVRCPLLDQELVAFAAAIPSRHKLSGLSGKAILRRAVKPWVPAPILSRRKKGFALPIDRWLREDLAGMVSDTLLDRTAVGRGLFERRAIENLIARHRRGEARGEQLWNLLMLEQWFRAFIDRGAA